MSVVCNERVYNKNERIVIEEWQLQLQSQNISEENVLWLDASAIILIIWSKCTAVMFGSQINTVQLRKWAVSEVYPFSATVIINRGLAKITNAIITEKQKIKLDWSHNILFNQKKVHQLIKYI